MTAINLEHIRPLQRELERHPVSGSLRTIGDLRVFMEHHVYAVWDFMSLVEYLRQHLSPARVPWMPSGDPSGRHFINQLVLEEESDSTPATGGGTRYASHFEHYCDAMKEIGADGEAPLRFLALVREKGIDDALYSDAVPVPSRYFSETTFGFIRGDKPHEVAAALAMGREHVVPAMFRRILCETHVGEAQAPSFHYHLKRHIRPEEDSRGPLALQLLETMCGDDPAKIEDAETAAEEAVCARIRFWDGILEAIQAQGHER